MALHDLKKFVELALWPKSTEWGNHPLYDYADTDNLTTVISAVQELSIQAATLIFHYYNLNIRLEHSRLKLGTFNLIWHGGLFIIFKFLDDQWVIEYIKMKKEVQETGVCVCVVSMSGTALWDIDEANS